MFFFVRSLIALTLLCVMGPFISPVRPANAQPPSAGVPTTDVISGPIRAADTLRVVVAGPEGTPLGGEFRVETEGTIAHPRLGTIKAVGRMPADIATEIKKRIEEKKLLKRADVAVYIIARRTREVLIAGAVTNNGKQSLKDGAVLSDVLEQAIPKSTADFSRVIVTRNGKDLEVNYLKYRNGVSKDREFNPSLEDGDRIFLYEAVPTVGVIRISGEIKDTTRVLIPLTEGATVGQILQLVGGITDFADRNGIVVVRSGLTLFVPYDDIVKKIPSKDITLQDKDEIKVPRLERPRQYTVAGAVQKGQTFPLTTKTTLLQALAQAGGTIDGAQQNKVEVRRADYKGNVTTKVYDLKKDMDATVELADGDYVFVPFPRHRPGLDIAAVVGIASSLILIFTQLKR